MAWNTELLDQLDFAWNYQFLPRMESLTDAEYFREPVENCWNVFRNDVGSWAVTWTEPEPFTTIGWRLVHIAIPIFGQRARNHFGDGTVSLETTPIPGSADDAMALVTEQYGIWREGVAALGEEGLERPCGPAEGPYKDHPFATLVLHINREFLHHAAEVAVLRDLYRGMDR
ncbi:MAG: DinB family protein [Chloroflexota bacterium]|nr:DinB family protein [Chloroflexota bacterium]